MFDKAIEQTFWQHALSEYPKEACGLIIDGGTEYVPMRNVHESPKMAFRMVQAEFIAYYQAGRISAVMHSHTGADYAAPSRADMNNQAEMQLPWGIVHISENRDIDGPFYFGDQVPIAPFEGRQFRHNVYDCYTLLRDFYRQELNITLPIFPREPEWWVKKQNVLEQNFAKAGFVQIDKTQARQNDVMLCRVQSPKDNPVANHVAIIRDSGRILHHLNRRLSKHEPMQMWINTCTTFLRYSGVGDA